MPFTPLDTWSKLRAFDGAAAAVLLLSLQADFPPPLPPLAPPWPTQLQGKASDKNCAMSYGPLNTVYVAILSFPLVTRSVIFAVVGLYVLGLALPLGPTGCLNSDSVSFRLGLWRLLSYWLVHDSGVTLILSLVPFTYVAGRLERALGSLRFLFVLQLLALTIGIAYVSALFIVTYMLRLGGSVFWHGCVAGLPALIICLDVVFVYSFSTEPTLRLGSAVALPQTAVPWILMLVALCLPGTSAALCFVALATGIAYVHGFLDFFQATQSRLLKVQSWSAVQRVATMPGFLRPPDALTSSAAATIGEQSLQQLPTAVDDSQLQPPYTVFPGASPEPPTPYHYSLAAPLATTVGAVASGAGARPESPARTITAAGHCSEGYTVSPTAMPAGAMSATDTVIAEDDAAVVDIGLE